MQTQAQSRKRPAPGTSPQSQPQQMAQNQYPTVPNAVADPSQLSDDQFIAWGQDNDQMGFADPSTYPSNFLSPQMEQNASNQLVRRNMNNELMARQQPFGQAGNELWSYENEGPGWEEQEDDAELERKAAAAKKEALSKRPPKQIPPFIQKLSSFLDNNHNTDLIRWSDDGNSFIVLDEDGFAKKLIPELFKHDKYASFVRQLNMYGFHKKVGLSDNSMRASEKKARSPSEYYNPYFKRGRPELLWLIQKPKNETSAVKKKGKGAIKNEEDAENADEIRPETEDAAQDASNQTDDNKDLVTLPKTQFSSLQQEVRALQRSQQQISNMLSRLRDENNQYIRQAGALVAQHERHETSINAILTFLATFYNRNLQGQGNFPNMFGNAIPSEQRQGSVVDVGDYDESTFSPSNDVQRPARRPLALLPAPESAVSEATSARSTPQETRQSVPRGSGQARPNSQSSQANRLRPLSNHSSNRSSPAPAGREASHSPATPVNPNNGEIMDVIKNANANANTSTPADPSSDFNNALQQFQNDGKGPLTPQQRDSMLSLMGAQSNAGDAAGILGDGADGSADYLHKLESHQEHLDMLHRLQREQDSKVQDLADRLHPLSPSGSIPGLSASGSQSWQPGYGADFDFGNFLDLGGDYLNEYPYPGAAGDEGEDGFGFDAPQATETDEKGEAAEVKEEGDDDDEDGSLFEEDNADDADADDAGAGGKVLGSVTGSSAAPSPQEQQDAREEGTRRSKRRKVG